VNPFMVVTEAELLEDDEGEGEVDARERPSGPDRNGDPESDVSPG
jgi:hypothetical protein